MALFMVLLHFGIQKVFHVLWLLKPIPLQKIVHMKICMRKRINCGLWQKPSGESQQFISSFLRTIRRDSLRLH